MNKRLFIEKIKDSIKDFEEEYFFEVADNMEAFREGEFSDDTREMLNDDAYKRLVQRLENLLYKCVKRNLSEDIIDRLFSDYLPELAY